PVRGVGLLRVPVPDLLLAEGDRRELGIGADGAGRDHLLDLQLPAGFEHVQAHRQVVVGERARVAAVVADAPDVGREGEDNLSTPEAQAPSISETLITPPRRIDWPVHELWEFRDLVYFLTKRELQIRYKQSFFGIAWAVMQPIALAFIFALIFGSIVHAPSEGIPYAVFVVAGVVPWLFTGQAVGMSANSLVMDSDL